ncbi:hypothetical protein BKA70DRAFT_1366349 [Coprinopsis sp. MPI-PUGE-AT-0042]|nr:hypothetical protein BKA70DRAFT_1366349 [Coprinopsis sp. MPI-PUGE-AT-0042]
MAASFQASKRALRKTVSAALGAVSEHSIEAQSSCVTNRVLALPQFREAKAVSCYLSMPTGEVDTSLLACSVLQSGKRLFVPRIVDKAGVMDFFEVFDDEDLATLPSGVWGIKEPGSHYKAQPRESALSASESGILDVILLPGVAFDRSMSRLGHGKGFYDRFIASYTNSSRRKPLLVGISLREQLLEAGSVPMADHDWKLDMIITPEETLVQSIPE